MQVGWHERRRVEQAEPGHTQHAVQEMPGIVALQIATDEVLVRNFTRRRSVRSLVEIAHYAAPKGSWVEDVRVHRMDIPYYRCAAGWISICQATMVIEM